MSSIVTRIKCCYLCRTGKPVSTCHIAERRLINVPATSPTLAVNTSLLSSHPPAVWKSGRIPKYFRLRQFLQSTINVTRGNIDSYNMFTCAETGKR